MHTPLTRRGFVAAGALAASSKAQSGWRFFSAEEAALVDALAEQIIPADDDPGARQAGVVHYIDRQLAGPLKRFAPAYRRGLPALEQSCLRLSGKNFLDLSFDEQTRFLQRVEKGEAPAAASFFQMLIDHTMQGYYGSPKHGGNRGAVSWKMLAIEDHMDHNGGGA